MRKTLITIVAAAAVLAPTAAVADDASDAIIRHLQSALDDQHEKTDCLEDQIAVLKKQVRYLRNKGKSAQPVYEGVGRATC